MTSDWCFENKLDALMRKDTGPARHTQGNKIYIKTTYISCYILIEFYLL